MKRNLSPKISPRYFKPSKEENTKTAAGGGGGNKLEGPTVWVMYMFTLTDDLLDPFVSFLLLGINIIPIAGQGLSAALSAISTFLSLLISFVIILYFRSNGVSLFSKKMAKRLILLLIELIPVLNILPMSTIFFYLTIKAENFSRQHKALSMLGKKLK